MSYGFLEAYGKLTDFAAKHPEIEIGDSVTSIPENVRPDFYGLFNTARGAFVSEKFPSYLARARVLKKEFDKAAEDASGWLSFEDPPTVDPLLRFLRDPKDCLTRELFDPLFDLLKGRRKIEEIERVVSPGIAALFAAAFRGGYEKWVVLNLLNLLDVEGAFRVVVRSLNPGERTKPAAQAPLDEIPAPQESTRFFFSQPRNAIFAVPDFIVYSSRLHRFIGIRSEFQQGLYNALNANPDREWDAVDPDLIKLLSKGLTLIYVAEEAEKIALVADAARFCRPDMVLWCVDAQNMDQREIMAGMEIADVRLKPPGGSFVISGDEWLESPQPGEKTVRARPGAQGSGFHKLTVGYERRKLMPLVEALVEHEKRERD